MFLVGDPGLLCLLLCSLLGCASAANVQVTVGSNATLPCIYDASYYGKQFTCWGRGPVPYRGCTSQVIEADGTRVTQRTSVRYQLAGRLDQGDSSLTIRQVQESDSGQYGCRVMIPGWFNDLKMDVTLKVVPGPPHALFVEVKEVRAKTLTIRWSSSFNGGRPITSYRVEVKDEQASWDTAMRTEAYNPELTQLTLVDLLPARSYNLRMFAVNVVGTSDASNTLPITTKDAAPGGPPLDVQLTALSTQRVLVTWKFRLFQPPRADLRNGNLVSYKISYRESDKAGRRWLDHHLANWPQSFNLTKLKPSTKYAVIVRAGTSAGFGPESAPQACSTFDETPVTKPPPPTVTVWDEGSTGPTTAPVSTESTTAWKTAATTLSPDRPDPPVLVLKEVDAFTISLVWTPGFQGGSTITSHILEYKAINASWDSTKIVLVFEPTETKTTILENIPSTYCIRMFSKNSQGTSEASNVLTVTTGHHEDATAATEATEATNSDASKGTEGGQGTNVAAIVVPVVLVLVVVAAGIAWQLHRFKQKHGNLSIRWLYRGAEQIKESESESMQEL